MPLGVFILRGVSLGVFCVLLYAAVRPRLGAGVKSAITTGLLAFLVGTLFPPFGLTMQAFAPARVLLETIIWNAIQLPLATVAGAWLYREKASERDAAQLVLGGF
jgi:ACR3 family arsenite efflux pump ArsB